jgi:hypothetical protein
MLRVRRMMQLPRPCQDTLFNDTYLHIYHLQQTHWWLVVAVVVAAAVVTAAMQTTRSVKVSDHSNRIEYVRLFIIRAALH